MNSKEQAAMVLTVGTWILMILLAISLCSCGTTEHKHESKNDWVWHSSYNY
jgi:hypothetical protein